MTLQDEQNPSGSEMQNGPEGQSSSVPAEQRLKEKDETIRRLEEKVELSDMMNVAGIDRVQILDPQLRILSWNSVSAAFSGLTRLDVVGRHFLDVFPEAKAWDGVVEALQHALKGRKSFVPADKGAYERGHFERHFTPLKDAEGTVRGVLVVIHDVAHRVAAEDNLKALNNELRQKLRELQRANAELATFTHVTSHDLKEPLRKIYTFVEMTVKEEEGKLSEKGKSNLRRVQSSVQRMGLLTDDLVMFSEVSAEVEVLELLDLSEVLAEAQKPLRKTIAETGAVITSEALPQLYGSMRQFVLLFQHLLSNALKFIEPGTPPVLHIGAGMAEGTEVPHPDAAPETQYHWVSFSDNGIGIEPEYFDKIFTLFQRLHDKGAYGGTGIGLAICKKVVEKRGGFITVKSATGAGSTFTCWLPQYKAASDSLSNMETGCV